MDSTNNQDSTQHQDSPAKAAYNQLLATLSGKENATMYSMLYKLLLQVPKLLAQLELHADKISVLAPTNNILAQLPVQLVTDLTSSKNNTTLIKLLENHIIGKQTVGGGSLPAVIPISKVLVPDSLRETVMKYTTPSSVPSNGNSKVPSNVPSNGNSKVHSNVPSSVPSNGNSNGHYPVIFESDMVGSTLPKWLRRAGPGNNWT